MSFFANDKQVCYRGDNLGAVVVIAEAGTSLLAEGIVSALNLTHVDVELHNDELRLTGPGVA